MKINILEEVLAKYGITENEALGLLIANSKMDVKEVMKGLELRGYLGKRVDMFNPGCNSYFLLDPGKMILTDVILDGDKSLPKEEDLTELATKLKELYPKGKNPKCNFYWTDGVILITKRLRAFFRKYGRYSDEDIIFATKTYVDSFNGDYQYMQLLKYFIFKDIKGADGTIECASTMLNIIEHKDDIKEDQVNGTNYDWRTALS